mgnify:CR=1 FL=1
MSVKAPKLSGHLIVWLMDDRYCQETVILKDGNSVKIGTLVGRLSSEDKVVPFDPKGKDGSEKIVGAAIAPVTADGDDEEIVIVSNIALLRANGIEWPDKINDTEKKAAVAQLNSLGIKLKGVS